MEVYNYGIRRFPRSKLQFWPQEYGVMPKNIKQIIYQASETNNYIHINHSNI